MGRKSKSKSKLTQELNLPFCYYCERDFEDEKVLISHQKAKHFKCSQCTRKLQTAGGLAVHLQSVHKADLERIENAIPGREIAGIEIFGMQGIPQADIQAHRKRKEIELGITSSVGTNPSGQPLIKKPRIDLGLISKQNIAIQMAAHRALKAGRLLYNMPQPPPNVLSILPIPLHKATGELILTPAQQQAAAAANLIAAGLPIPTLPPFAPNGLPPFPPAQRPGFAPPAFMPPFAPTIPVNSNGLPPPPMAVNAAPPPIAMPPPTLLGKSLPPLRFPGVDQPQQMNAPPISFNQQSQQQTQNPPTQQQGTLKTSLAAPRAALISVEPDQIVPGTEALQYKDTHTQPEEHRVKMPKYAYVASNSGSTLKGRAKAEDFL